MSNGVGAAAAALFAVVLLLASAAPAAAQYPYPYEAFDRRPMAGWARGKKAAGRPDPIPGLTNPDVPATGNLSASMEGELWAMLGGAVGWELSGCTAMQLVEKASCSDTSQCISKTFLHPSPTDLVLPFGYPLETYPIETSDGFVLRLYRIPYGKTNSTKYSKDKPVVLLHHGVTLASSSFVCLDPASSMGFYLADAGFDVWMANTRGNTYSRGNRFNRDTDAAYWYQSMDELALIDLPTQIDEVLRLTGKPSLALVGHSQGCTLPVMLLAMRPEYNEKIWLLTLLGPVTFAEEIRAPFLSWQAKTRSAQVCVWMRWVRVGEL